MCGPSIIAYIIERLSSVEYYPLTSYSIMSLLIIKKEEALLVTKAEWEAIKKQQKAMIELCQF